MPLSLAARWQGYGLVLLAATLWGTFPILLRLLLAGVPALTPVDLATLRASTAFLLLFIPLLVRYPRLLRVRRRDLPYFALHGTVGIAAFYAVYAEAIARNSVAVAVVLLYTSPAWVTLLAWRLYGEPLGR